MHDEPALGDAVAADHVRVIEPSLEDVFVWHSEQAARGPEVAA